MSDDFEPFDQDVKLGPPPWKPEDPALQAWEAAHGHDVRLKCYVEFGCQVIEPALERKVASLTEENERRLNRINVLQAQADDSVTQLASERARVERLLDEVKRLNGIAAENYGKQVEAEQRVASQKDIIHTLQETIISTAQRAAHWEAAYNARLAGEVSPIDPPLAQEE